MPERTTHATCTICEATCGISIVSNGRRIESLRGDSDDPFSRGHVCPKAIGLRDLQEDPDRLRRPLRRTATGFEEISWQDAYAQAAAGIARIREVGGPDAVALYRGNPAIHDFATLLGANVITRGLGTKNVYSAGPNDTWPRYVQSTCMYGGPLRQTIPDIDRCDYLLVVGANPLVSNGSLMTAPGVRQRLAALRARGGKIVVIDPRRSETAQKADEHHFITPGSDAAFLLSMVHVLFDEGLVTLGACEGRVSGLADVERIVADYAPAAVAPRCAIDASTIRRLTRELAGASSAATYGRLGACVQRFGTLTSWALDLLAILSGNLDRPGGSMFANPAATLHGVTEADWPVRFGRWTSRVSAKDEIMGEFPTTVLAEEIETPGAGQVRGLVTIAGNPARTFANSNRIERALESLEFMVSLDYYVNETTRHADLILPPTGPLERGHYDLALNHFAIRNVAKWSAPVFEPEPDSRDAWTTSLELARRFMGLDSLELPEVDALVLRQFAGIALAGSTFREELSIEQVLDQLDEGPGPERVLDTMIRLGAHGDGFGRRREGLTLAKIKDAKHGLDLGPLTPMLPGQIRTESGSIELAPQRLLSDVPRLAAWLSQEPEPGLQLINRRDIRSMNSWLHNLPALSKGRDRCTLQIHPDDARTRGLASGETALVRTRVGELEAPVEVTPAVMPGVVSLPHGFGHTGEGLGLGVAAKRPGANVNAVTDDIHHDVPSGSTMLFGAHVEVTKADARPS
jgi:anaerobic selenocysteine-containing dehydrogenase